MFLFSSSWLFTMQNFKTFTLSMKNIKTISKKNATVTFNCDARDVLSL